MQRFSNVKSLQKDSQEAFIPPDTSSTFSKQGNLRSNSVIEVLEASVAMNPKVSPSV